MDALEKRKQIEEFKLSLKNMSLEELRELEKKIIADAEENDKKTTETKFPLPKENYKEVAAGIRKLLNKQTVEWRFTLGLVAMYDFWNPEKYSNEIVYPMLDGTLRTLGEMQFTGYEEWAAVVAINKYFEALHEAYANVTEKTFDIASQHNCVMDELKLREPHDESIPAAVGTN